MSRQIEMQLIYLWRLLFKEVHLPFRSAHRKPVKEITIALALKAK